MLRLIHNRSIVKYFLAALGLAFAFYFAWSFYPFGEWVGKHFLQDAPGGPTVLGLVSAAILGGCVLIVVFYKEYIKEDTHRLFPGHRRSLLRQSVWVVRLLRHGVRTVLGALSCHLAQLLASEHCYASALVCWAWLSPTS